METNNISRLFNEFSLFEEKEFIIVENYDSEKKVGTLNTGILLEIMDFLGISNDEKLITKCIFCKKEFPFNYSLNCTSYEYQKQNGYIKLGDFFNKTTGITHYVNIYFNSSENFSVNRINDFKTSNQIQFCFLDYLFYCTNKQYHEYAMKLLVIYHGGKMIIKKIGQFPENTLLKVYKSNEYKNILRRFNDSYIDYQNSEKSFASGLYSGSYAYLRRVYENMINYYLKKNNIEIEKNMNAKGKIKYVEHEFCEDIRQLLSPLYSVLSIGIHQLKEEECKENYIELKAIIDMQLVYIKMLDEKEKQLKSSELTIKNMMNKYSKT